MAYGRFEILVLCSVLALARVDAGGWQTNLTTQQSDGLDGNVVLKVSWAPASGCLFKFKYLVTLSDGNAQQQVGPMAETSVTFDADYWTNYTVSCKANCIRSNTISTTLYTGPGNPRAVGDIWVEPQRQTANVRIAEAVRMPKPVTHYKAMTCPGDTKVGCNTTFIDRSDVDHGIVTTDLTGLQPSKWYNFYVTPQIVTPQKLYEGETKGVAFRTLS